jgi:hypothetical protein
MLVLEAQSVKTSAPFTFAEEFLKQIFTAMKAIKLVSVVAVMLAAAGFAAATGQRANSIKSGSPKALVADLYRQHKQRSPFFQTRSRALLDKYFTRELADLLWQKARSSRGEVGALDGDPLYNAQDMEIKNFSIQDGTGGPRMMEVPVTFENFGAKQRITFRLFANGVGWKIGNIEYDDGSSLLEILKHDRNSAPNSQTIKIYLVAVGDDGKTGKKFGCGDSLVAVPATIKKTAAPLTAAIRELLLTPQHPEGTPNLENFWKGRNLKVTSVAIVNHTATIHLSGEVFVAGVCDEPRIQSQIEETARQFPNVRKVKVFLGKQTLAAAIR